MMMAMFSRRTDWKLAPNQFTLVHREVLGEGREISDLTISNPTRAGIEYDESTILDSLRNSKSLDYDPQPKGLLCAREAVAEYYSSGWDSPFSLPQGKPVQPTGEARSAFTNPLVDPEALILTTSTSEGYAHVFRLLCDPGDEVLVAKPSYPLFEFLADLEDVRLVSYPLIYDHGWQIDLHSLERAITERTRGIVLVHPNNPTGSFVSSAERSRLNQLCGERGLAMIADEVFLDYAHDGQRRPSFTTNEDAVTFTLSGLSKISALPQMKLAWIAVSGPKVAAAEAMHQLEVIGDTYLSVDTPVQLAAATLLNQRHETQPQLMQRIQANLAELDRQLAQQKSCVRLETEGGWYVILRVPVIKSDEELAVELLRERSVLVHPGHFYDFPHDGYLVLSLITPETTFREGILHVLQAF